MDAYVDARLSLEGRDLDKDSTTDLAKRYFHGRVADSTLETWSEDAVAKVWGNGVNVERFVPVLAIRLVRERVRLASADAQRRDSNDLGFMRAADPASSVLQTP